MLDTVILNITSEKFTISTPEKFSPNANLIHRFSFTHRKSGVASCISNPTSEQQYIGYFPRLTLYKKHSNCWLKIELSVPKLLYGNNFQECSDHDIEPFIKKLLSRLKQMGVETTYNAILTARLPSIHYSKNLFLKPDTPCHLLIKTLSKIDLSSRLDLTKTDFRNAGQMIKYHATSYEIALYDKIKDLKHVKSLGEKRGAETDYYNQTDLLPAIKTPEILRFEIRFTKSQKAKQILRTLNIDVDMTLKNLFCEKISQTILLHYWSEIIEKLHLINLDINDTEKVILSIKKIFPSKRITSCMSLVLFIQACQQYGVLGAKLLLGLNTTQFYRLKADAKKLDNLYYSPNILILNSIHSQLKIFKPCVRGDVFLNTEK